VKLTLTLFACFQLQMEGIEARNGRTVKMCLFTITMKVLNADSGAEKVSNKKKG